MKGNHLGARLVFSFGEFQIEDCHIVRFKARIHVQKAHEALDQQASDDEQNERESKFRDDQPFPYSTRSAISRVRC